MPQSSTQAGEPVPDLSEYSSDEISRLLEMPKRKLVENLINAEYRCDVLQFWSCLAVVTLSLLVLGLSIQVMRQ